MGKIIRFSEEKASKDKKLGDLLTEIAISDSESLDSVETVRKIRESG